MDPQETPDPPETLVSQEPLARLALPELPDLLVTPDPLDPLDLQDSSETEDTPALLAKREILAHPDLRDL